LWEMKRSRARRCRSISVARLPPLKARAAGTRCTRCAAWRSFRRASQPWRSRCDGVPR
jgi:hypothetical protein